MAGFVGGVWVLARVAGRQTGRVADLEVELSRVGEQSAFGALVGGWAEALEAAGRAGEALTERGVRVVVVGGAAAETAVVEVEEVDRAVGVRAVVPQHGAGDAVGGAGLTVVGEGGRYELPRGTGRPADSGADLLKVGRSRPVAAGKAVVQADVGAGETPGRAGVARIGRRVGPKGIGTVEQTGIIMQIEMEPICREATSDTIGGSPSASLTPTTQHTLMISDITILPSRTATVAVISSILQEIISSSITGTSIALTIADAVACGATGRTSGAS